MTVETMPLLGAVPTAGGTAFRVWAPNAGSVSVLGRELERGEGGVWEAELDLPAGTDYRYALDGDEWPDPCSRFQPEGVRGPSRVVDTGAFEWRDDG